jgi:hypothetical protein
MPASVIAPIDKSIAGSTNYQVHDEISHSFGDLSCSPCPAAARVHTTYIIQHTLYLIYCYEMHS